MSDTPESIYNAHEEKLVEHCKRAPFLNIALKTKYPAWPLLSEKIEALQDVAGLKLYEKFHADIMKYYDDQKKAYAESIRLRFEFDRDPEIGERAILWNGKTSYFGSRTSQNCFQSGRTTFPMVADGQRFVTLVECQEEKPEDAKP
ncbi:MAG: hypothetical protein ABIH23_13120 [bacterium]